MFIPQDVDVAQRLTSAAVIQMLGGVSDTPPSTSKAEDAGDY